MRDTPELAASVRPLREMSPPAVFPRGDMPLLKAAQPSMIPPRPARKPLDGRWAEVAAALGVVYQPVVNIHSGACYGFDVLIEGSRAAGYDRMADLLDAAHADGALAELELALCEKGLSGFGCLRQRTDFKLFLNLDSRALDGDNHLIHRLREMVGQSGVAESAVVLELSERHPRGGSVEAGAAMRRVRRQGFRLALDDFGTGFAGVELLYLAEPDILKVHRPLFADMLSDAKKKMFLSHVVNLAHLLGVAVVAEGVETEREFMLCKDMGCDLIQGGVVWPPVADPEGLPATFSMVAELARRERRSTATDQHIVADQVIRTPPLSISAPMAEVFSRFRSDKSATFFPVVDDSGQPMGIVREKELKDYTYSPFGRELMANKAFGRTLKDFLVRCPMADINSRAEQILEAYSAVERSEGIMIADGLSYVGFLSAQSLLRVINEKNLAAARDQNPLSRLPGNTVIADWVSVALAATDTAHTLAYFDFDNFKPFNDKYGFRLGDRAILLFADLLSKAMGRDGGFAGHIGGDDFFGGFQGIDFDEALTVWRTLVESFRHDVESFYDDETRRLGFIQGHDRLGNPASFPLMTVSAVVVRLPAGREHRSIDDISRIIAGLKGQAKTAPDHLAAATLD